MGIRSLWNRSIGQLLITHCNFCGSHIMRICTSFGWIHKPRSESSDQLVVKTTQSQQLPNYLNIRTRTFYPTALHTGLPTLKLKLTGFSLSLFMQNLFPSTVIGFTTIHITIIPILILSFHLFRCNIVGIASILRTGDAGFIHRQGNIFLLSETSRPAQ